MPRRLPRIRIFSAESVESLPSILPFRRRYFTLLLAWDPGGLTREEMGRLLQPIADRGLAYFCAWGNRCEEVHDAVDQWTIPRWLQGGQLNFVTMTTWHANDELEKAAWYFKDLAIPSEPYVFADFERYAVTIGNPEWAVRMEKALRPPRRKRFISIPMKVFPPRSTKHKYPPS